MNGLFDRWLLFAPDDAAGGGGDGKDKPPEGDKGDKGDKDAGDKAPLVFETWIKDQPKEVRELIAANESGLKTALGSERDARTDAEKAVRDLAKKAEKGSEAEAELTSVADSLAEETRKADFYADAHDEGISNLKLAYVIAVQEKLIDARGNMNFGKLKEQYPELFGKPARRPAGGAGDGAGDDLGQKPDMNTFIRRQAGRQ